MERQEVTEPTTDTVVLAQLASDEQIDRIDDEVRHVGTFDLGGKIHLAIDKTLRKEVEQDGRCHLDAAFHQPIDHMQLCKRMELEEDLAHDTNLGRLAIDAGSVELGSSLFGQMRQLPRTATLDGFTAQLQILVLETLGNARFTFTHGSGII